MNVGEEFAGYLIEGKLGAGGMGSVYLARHPRLPRLTALKLLSREMFSDRESRVRFEREADLVARLDHPNIVAVYDRGVQGEQPWISMQYIDGPDASSIDPRSLPPERAVQITAETAAALDYAHSMGILHRDVKPANILLARAIVGGLERVFLTDFGIARLRDDTVHLTETGTFTATLAYASPEQLTSSPMDHRSDQYSLACSLFWMLTGVGPFASTNPATVIQGHLMRPPTPVSSVRPGLPPAVDVVLAKGMAKNPADRFASCAEFAEAARWALSGRPTPAAWQAQAFPPPQQPAPPAYAAPVPAAPRSTRTKVGWMAGAALVAILLVVGTVVVIKNQGSSDPAAPTAAPSSTTKEPAVTAEWSAMAQAFPGLLPQEGRSGPGWNGVTCYPRRPGDQGDTLSDPNGAQTSNWLAQWDCPDDKTYLKYSIMAFPTADAARAAAAALPPNTKYDQPKKDDNYNNYRWRVGAPTDPSYTSYLVTGFENDPVRSRFLLYARAKYEPALKTGTTEKQFVDWFFLAPLK